MSYIIGVDEAGRGPLAGSVFAGAVLYNSADQPLIKGLTDSKKLTAKKRESLYSEIQQKAVFSNVQFVTPAEIDKINILQATLLAMKRAIEQAIAYLVQTLSQPITDLIKIYIDGNQSPKLSSAYLQNCVETVIQGDLTVPVISAASILAKVERDREMQLQSAVYPEYFFEKHKGYGTKLHIEMLQKHGPCEIHRKTFAPVKNLLALPEV